MMGIDKSEKNKKISSRTLDMSIVVLISLILLTGPLISTSFLSEGQEDVAYSVTIDGNIDGGTASHIQRAISRAEEDGRDLIIKIDTPGGLVNPTRDIVNAILRSDVEVITWITPRGAWGYSAGAFITLAGDIAVMDRGTSIGSAEPRPADNKTIQAMASWIQEIAEDQGRPGEEARKFVTENMNIGAEEALDIGLIDHIAESDEELLNIIGRSRIEQIEQDFTAQLMSILTNPTIVFLLLLIGILGLVTEITTGGVGVPGIGGGIALILAFIGLRILELSTVGIFLIILGIVLLIAEYFEPGFGVFGIGGAISLFLGILFVGDEPWIEVSTEVLLGLVVIILGITLFVIWSVRKALKKEVETGMDKMKGAEGSVTKRLDPIGVVKVRGERWAATSEMELEEGENVVVKDIVERKGQTTLLVERTYDE